MVTVDGSRSAGSDGGGAEVVAARASGSHEEDQEEDNLVELKIIIVNRGKTVLLKFSASERIEELKAKLASPEVWPDGEFDRSLRMRMIRSGKEVADELRLLDYGITPEEPGPHAIHVMLGPLKKAAKGKKSEKPPSEVQPAGALASSGSGRPRPRGRCANCSVM